MTSFRVVLALIVIPIVIMFVTVPVEANANISSTDDGKILIINGSNWMKLDPISDHIVGDTFNLTGTTNLPVGTPLVSGVFSYDFFCHEKICSNETMESHTLGNWGEVQSGIPDHINQISFQYNTGKLISADYFGFSIQAPSINAGYDTHMLMFPTTSREKIHSLFIPSFSHERYWLLIDSLDNSSRPLNEGPEVKSPFQVTGLTNLPAGERIPYSLLSSEGFYSPGSTNQTISLASNSGYVLTGEKNGVNRFVVDVDASRICNNNWYWVVIWNPRYNATMPDDFMSTSMNFHCNKTVTNTSITLSTTPSSDSMVIPATKSPVSSIGTCIAVIVAGLLALTYRKGDRW